MKSRLLAGIVIVSAIVGGGIAYAWNRATVLPEWYTQGEVVPDAAVSTGELISNNAADLNGDGQLEVTLNETEFNQVVVSALAERPQTAPLLDHAKGINTSIDRDRIESGLVMNLSEIPAEALPPQAEQALTQLTDTFPMLAGRDIYMGIEGSPQIVEGELRFDEDAVLKVGQFSMPLSDVAGRMGLSQAELERQLSGLLAQQGVSLEDIQISDGQITLSGDAQ
ncbi:MAG: hypothetical protein AAF921_15805 [Cyanobacteria bacterium P01_D01_bin.44]